MNKGNLIWSDEFESSGEPSSANWRAETGNHGWGNNEKQNYTPNKNAKRENGNLVIKSRREDYGGMTLFIHLFLLSLWLLNVYNF